MEGPVTRALERVWRRLELIAGRGRVKAADDSGGVQTLQVQFSDRELRDNTPRVGEYGFASMPLPGCQALVLFVAGDRSNGVVCGTNDEANRLKNLQPGEAAIFDDQGQSVWIKRGGIEIHGAGKPVTIKDAPMVRMETALLEVTGDIKDLCDTPAGKTMAGMRGNYNGHTHTDPQGGSVGAPTPTM